MASQKRDNLEKRAKQLGLSFVPETSDDELQELINDFQNKEDVDAKGDFSYFKSANHGMDVIIGDPDPTKGEVAHPTVSFVPYFVEKKGVEGKLKIGYLKTDNGSAIKKLSETHEATKISKKEYDEATKEVFDDGKPPAQIGGFRAPY